MDIKKKRVPFSGPKTYWIDFFIDDALFESFWNHPEMSFGKLKRFDGKNFYEIESDVTVENIF